MSERIVLEEGGVISLDSDVLITEGDYAQRAVWLMDEVIRYCQANPSAHVLVLAPTMSRALDLRAILLAGATDGHGNRRGIRSTRYSPPSIIFENEAIAFFFPATSQGLQETQGMVFAAVAYEDYDLCEARVAFLPRIRQPGYPRVFMGAMQWPPLEAPV